MTFHNFFVFLCYSINAAHNQGEGTSQGHVHLETETVGAILKADHLSPRHNASMMEGKSE
jgi:hypothetical protein